LSSHDSLTGLLNRRGIDAAIEAHVEAHKGEPLALALIDIDDFKTVNDLYGHAVGDKALRVLARNLHEIMPETAILGRNGGDEALVALAGKDGQHVEELIGQLVRKGLAFEMGGSCYKIGLSVGYSWCSGLPENITAAYAEADAALYSVKYSGKSDYRRFTPGMDRYRVQRGFASRNVAEYLPEPVIVLQEETSEILFANEATVRLLDCESLHDLMAYSRGTLFELIHPDDRQRISASLAEWDGGKMHLQFRLLAKDGSSKELALSSHCVDLGEGRRAVYAVLFEQD
jgi:diguanylate cyclase (GGDEF)-like protein